MSSKELKEVRTLGDDYPGHRLNEVIFAFENGRRHMASFEYGKSASQVASRLRSLADAIEHDPKLKEESK